MVENCQKFVDKTLVEYDNRPSVYITGKICRSFGKFKRVHRAEHGKGASKFDNILEKEGENCYIPSENVCFLECVKYNFWKFFNKEYFESIQSFRRRNSAMTRSRKPDFVKDIK